MLPLNSESRKTTECVCQFVCGGENQSEKVISNYVFKLCPEYVHYMYSICIYQTFCPFCSQRYILSGDKFFHYDLNKSNILFLVCIPTEIQGNTAI